MYTIVADYILAREKHFYILKGRCFLQGYFTNLELSIKTSDVDVFELNNAEYYEVVFLGLVITGKYFVQKPCMFLEPFLE